MKRISFTIVLSATLLLLATCFSCKEENTITTKTIGITLPLTGDSPLDIDAHQAAIDLAIEDVNNYLSQKDFDIQVKANIQNTENTPEGVISALNYFTKNKIKYIAAAGVSQNYIDAESTYKSFGGTIVHATSTATSLSISDNIFRIIPDDLRTAKEISDKIVADGIKEIIILHRDDTWGTELFSSIKTNYENSGYKVNGIEYEARFIPDCISSLMANALTQYNESIQRVSTNELAIVALAFSEIDEILNLSSNNTALQNVKWYGSDGYILNNRLIENSTLSEIASNVGLFCPAIASPTNEAYQAVVSTVSNKLGYTPRTNNFKIYDAVWAAAIALSKNSSNPINATKDALTESHYIFGDLSINDNGDCDECDYQYWYIKNDNGTIAWSKVD